MKMNDWDPEHVVAQDTALALIQKQFPELQARAISFLGAGVDNTAFVINDAFIFRFPRKKEAVSLLEMENCILPKIVPYLPASIPIPKWIGKPDKGFPWPFAGYSFLPGTTACCTAIAEKERAALAKPLAEFLAKLHAIPLQVGESCKLPNDTMEKLHAPSLIAKIEKNLEELHRLHLIKDIHAFDPILTASYTSLKERRIVHGDFYARHILLDASHQLAGVIDWGDIHLGDPAVDLMIAHSFLPQTAHPVFRKTYGKISESSWQLARLRALYSSSRITLYGHHTKDPIVREGLEGLSRLK